MFLSFVSPRIIQEIRSIPSARLGGGGAASTVRGCSQHHVPPALCWLLSLVGRRHHPGDEGGGEWGGGWDGGDGGYVHHLDVLDAGDFCFQSRDLRVKRVSIRG